MITQHPHQYMYFNILPRNPQNDFELDYWHVSNVNAIRKLYQKNKYIGQAKTIAYDYTIFPALTMLDDRERRYFFVVSRFGFYDCIIVINDNNCEEGKYHDPFPLQIPRKVISDEIVWVKNSLGTKKVMVYRIVEFEQNGNVDIKPVKY